MTLVAAYKVDGVPLLLGDFLITSGELSGTRKKIHRISENLVVGWSGDRLAAQPVLKALHDQFHNECVQYAALEELLTQFPTEELGSLNVQITGWVIDDEARCFFWRSDYPSELFNDDQYFIGTGGETFKQMLTRRSYLVSSKERKGVAAAIYLSLVSSCRMVTDEILFGLNRQQGFGFAFETAYFDGHQFRFVDNILYSAADIFYDPLSGQIHHRFYPITLKYRSFGSYSVIQTNELTEPRTRVFAVTPIFDNMPDLLSNIPDIDPSTNKVLPLSSDYYCMFWRLWTRQRPARYDDSPVDHLFTADGVGVDPGDGPMRLIEVTSMDNGEQKLEVDFSFIRTLYPEILNSGWSASITSKQKIVAAGKGLQFRIGGADTDIAVGLSCEAQGKFTDLPYALWFRPGGQFLIYESGVPIGQPRPYKTDDVFSIDLISAEGLELVMYTQNRQPIELTKCNGPFPLVPRTLAKEGHCAIREANIRTLVTTDTHPNISSITNTHRKASDES
jgi:hypothetical protein